MDPISVWMVSIGIHPEFVFHVMVRNAVINLLQKPSTTSPLESIAHYLLNGHMPCCTRRIRPCYSTSENTQKEHVAPLVAIITGNIPPIQISCTALDLVLQYQSEAKANSHFESWLLCKLDFVPSRAENETVRRSIHHILLEHGGISKMQLISNICGHWECDCEPNATCRTGHITHIGRLRAVEHLLVHDFSLPLTCLSVCLIDHYARRHNTLPQNVASMIGFVKELRLDIANK